MKFPEWLTVVGDRDFKGDCKPERVEQVEFFARLRAEFPSLAAVAIHPRNEGKRTMHQASLEKQEGMNPGASDIIIPCAFPIIIEMKRKDHRQSRWQKGQLEYLEAAKDLGCMVAVALGAEAAIEFVRKATGEVV